MADHEADAAEATQASPGQPGSPPQRPPARNVPLAIGWAAVVAAGGGLLCGLALQQFAMYGTIVLWPLGFVGGLAARKMMGAPQRVVAWCLVGSCIVAAVIGETCWIQWNLTMNGKPPSGWFEALTWLPLFFKENSLPTLAAGVMTALGAWSAYQQTAHRYRLVAVVDD